MLAVSPARRVRPKVVLRHLAERDRLGRRRDPRHPDLVLAHQRIDTVRQQLACPPAPLARRRQAKYERAAEAVMMLPAVELVALLPVRVGATRDYEVKSALVQMLAGLALAQ